MTCSLDTVSNMTELLLKIIDIYCRISQDYEGNTRSVDSQEDDGRADVEARHGCVVGVVHKDHAKSAWSPKVIREEWNALMARLESGAAHGVWVYDLSRFTRKPIEGERLIEAARRGLLVLSADSSYDLTTADGRKQFRDAMTAAAHESDKISQRTSRGKRKKAAKGRSNAGRRPYAMPGYMPKPAGWAPGDPLLMVSDEQLAAERAVIQEAARRLLGGESLNSIAQDFNRRGIPTAAGSEWDSQGLRSILKRSSMAGRVSYRGEDVADMVGAGDPVLDRPTWDALQVHFASRRRGPIPTRYLLSAGGLRCGICGSTLAGRPRSNVIPYPDGARVREYWCAYRKYGIGCGRLSIDQRYADEIVSTAVLDRLGDPAHADRLARSASRATAERSRLVAEIATAEDAGRAMADKMGRGEMRMDRYAAFEAGLDIRLAQLNAELNAIDGPESPTAAADAQARWDEAAESGNLTIQRRMVREAFPRLTIRPPSGRGPGALTLDRFDWDGRSLNT